MHCLIALAAGQKERIKEKEDDMDGEKSHSDSSQFTCFREEFGLVVEKLLELTESEQNSVTPVLDRRDKSSYLLQPPGSISLAPITQIFR
ncbi:hypothetical protein GUJ93_ZPchr0001g30612 [Zizania palustris]|uniref:Uncharacterized protein n=1 Tax=Zizania palustris TaxID=103762 RepID=A0A8J5V933_ZIZPA|nr:hypothetical protein GUJ93_ZPchr0001g30612 [Zizania palustris]